MNLIEKIIAPHRKLTPDGSKDTTDYDEWYPHLETAKCLTRWVSMLTHRKTITRNITTQEIIDGCFLDTGIKAPKGIMIALLCWHFNDWVCNPNGEYYFPISLLTEQAIKRNLINNQKKSSKPKKKR